MNNQTTVILCGGKSRRMGMDKAKLKIGEETFLSHSIHEFKAWGPLFVSVGKGRKYPEIDVPIIEDIFDDCGPLGGLHASLQRCETETLFVTTVDLPFVDRELAEELASYLSVGIDAVIPVAEDGRLHPLCAVYRKCVEKEVESQLKKKDYKVRNLLANLRVCYVPAGKLKDGERKLQNINTPEDYTKIRENSDSKKSNVKIPVVGMAAYSGSGKTTFLEKLIRELKKRNLRLAVIKHDGHDFTIDKEGKDTDRFAKAGADMVSIISATKAAKMAYYPVSLLEMIESIQDVDLILLEGFKKERYPKIMLFREAAGQPLALDFSVEQPMIIVSDQKEWGDVKCPVFGLEEIKEVADFLVKYIKE